MELFSSPSHYLTAGIVFILGLFLVRLAAKFFGTKSKRATTLYLWHSLFCLFYALFLYGDAIGYYKHSFSSHLEFGFGTVGIWWLTSFFSQVLNLSYLGCFLLYQIFGCLGMLAFDASLREVTYTKNKRTRQLANLIIFLPSVSIWSSAIGKDALSFMAMGFALWAALNLKRRIPLLCIAILAMLFVRPHMAGLMIIGLSASMALQGKIPIFQRLIVGGLAITAASSLIPIAMEYTGLGEETNNAEVMQYVDGRQGQNLGGGSSLDIASMSLPMQLFTYLFRPLPFEAHSFSAFAASIDNVILLYLFFVGGKSLFKKIRSTKMQKHNRMFLWIYSLLAWCIMSMTTANLGIAMRQKWMFTPMLIFLLISLIGKDKPQVDQPNPP